jgi:hypothetical protein
VPLPRILASLTQPKRSAETCAPITMGMPPTNQASSTASSVNSLADTTTTTTKGLDYDEKHDGLFSTLDEASHRPISSNDATLDEKTPSSNENGTTAPLTVVGGKDNAVQANNIEISKADGHIEGQEEEDEDENVVYPKGLPLALLTFGLCIANLAVALGKFINPN